MPRREQPELTVRFDAHARPPVLAVTGELDIGSAPVLREALLRLLGGDTVDDVVLDLSGVSFVDSSGLAVLLMGARRWGASEARMLVRSASPTVQRLLDLTGVRRAFTFEEEPPQQAR